MLVVAALLALAPGHAATLRQPESSTPGHAVRTEERPLRQNGQNCKSIRHDCLIPRTFVLLLSCLIEYNPATEVDVYVLSLGDGNNVQWPQLLLRLCWTGIVSDLNTLFSPARCEGWSEAVTFRCYLSLCFFFSAAELHLNMLFPSRRNHKKE